MHTLHTTVAASFYWKTFEKTTDTFTFKLKLIHSGLGSALRISDFFCQLGNVGRKLPPIISLGKHFPRGACEWRAHSLARTHKKRRCANPVNNLFQSGREQNLLKNAPIMQIYLCVLPERVMASHVV